MQELPQNNAAPPRNWTNRKWKYWVELAKPLVFTFQLSGAGYQGISFATRYLAKQVTGERRKINITRSNHEYDESV
jgi:hypothetical protein